jgi:NADH-quinone oxidoreductase subunit G
VPAGGLQAQRPRDAPAIAQGLADGALGALYLLHQDPLRDLPRAELWREALARAGSVVAHAAFLTEGIREHADVVFPAESYAEKEGTVVHPDGRLQRLRPAIARPGAVRAEWQVLAELSRRLGRDLEVLTGAMASRQLFASVPFYAGLTLEEIGGQGMRWQERDAAGAYPAPQKAPARPGRLAAEGEEAADLAGWRSVWDAVEVERSPALRFLAAGGAAGRAAAPGDGAAARRAGVSNGASR